MIRDSSKAADTHGPVVFSLILTRRFQSSTSVPGDRRFGPTALEYLSPNVSIQVSVFAIFRLGGRETRFKTGRAEITLVEIHVHNLYLYIKDLRTERNLSLGLIQVIY